MTLSLFAGLVAGARRWWRRHVVDDDPMDDELLRARAREERLRNARQAEQGRTGQWESDGD